MLLHFQSYVNVLFKSKRYDNREIIVNQLEQSTFASFSKKKSVKATSRLFEYPILKIRPA